METIFSRMCMGTPYRISVTAFPSLVMSLDMYGVPYKISGENISGQSNRKPLYTPVEADINMDPLYI